jgi:hypothetical protein
MRRRDFITLLCGAAIWPAVVHAQPARKLPRIGILMPGPPERSTSIEAFFQGLHELGYTEQQNIVVERRFGEWKPDRLADLAAELVRLNVDVIVAWSTPPAIAARRATRTIPIVAAGRECYGNDLSWPGVDRQTSGAAQGDPSGALPRSCSLASPCLRRTHDGKRRKGDRRCSAGAGAAASTRTSAWSG